MIPDRAHSLEGIVTSATSGVQLALRDQAF